MDMTLHSLHVSNNIIKEFIFFLFVHQTHL
jgi:hypothetical protein